MNAQQGRAQNNWRRNASSPPVQGNNAVAYNQAQQLVQLQQQQFMQQQQELYALQQAQMEMQLQQLRLQNREMQERFLAASSGQQSVAIPAENRRRSALFATNAPVSAPAMQSSFTTPEQSQDARRGALQHLQRAQQHRQNSGDSDDMGQLRNAKRPSRLSFVGGEGLAEHALARKRSGVFSPPATPPISAPAAHLTHHRKTSSASSGGSQFADRKHLSPPGGPTLVLSEPGEMYPASTFTRSPRSLTVTTGEVPPAGESDASSPHSSDTDSNSEVASFESVTTVGSTQDALKPAPTGNKRAVSESAASLSAKNLNPAASAFTPNSGTLSPSPEPTQSITVNKRNSASLGFNYPSTLDRSAGFRNFTAPPAMMSVGAVAVRQPKGPAKEDELEVKNFGGRLRKKALSTLNRRSFQPPVVAVEA